MNHLFSQDYKLYCFVTCSQWMCVFFLDRIHFSVLYTSTNVCVLKVNEMLICTLCIF